MKQHPQVLPGAEAIGSMQVDDLVHVIGLLREHGLTEKQIAAEAGYTPGALSSFKNGKYTAQDGAFEMALRSALERILDRLALKDTRRDERFRPTRTSVVQSVFAAARMCQLHGQMGLMTGPAGIGKTTGAKMYRAANSGVIVVRSSKMMTKKHVMMEIADQAGVKSTGSAYDMLKRVCDKLKDGKRLIIMDEAENFTLDILSEVRLINDWAGTGILYVGLPEFQRMLAQARKTHEYLVERFRLKQEVVGVGLSDVEALVQSELPDVNGQVKTFAQLAKGSVRFVETLTFRVAARIERSGEPLTDGLIAEVAESLRIINQ